MRLALLPAALAALAFAQDPGPDAIERMKQAALTYTEHLQDFTCSQFLIRSLGPSPDGTHWKRLDTQESQLDFVNRKEHYTLLQVNGKPVDRRNRTKPGYWIPGYEFASVLKAIFDPKAKAQFEFDHRENGAAPTCAYRYDVSVATSTYSITANQDTVRLGHHGMVWAACDTGAVAHFQMETDIRTVTQHGTVIPLGYRLEVRYAPVTIGEQQYVLPQSSVSAALFYKSWTKVEIEFRQYRKYGANSTVKFDDGKQ